MRILLVATAPSDPYGTGWNRRVYQVEQDLIEVCDAEVLVFDANRAVREHLPSRPASVFSMVGRGGWNWFSDRVSDRAQAIFSNTLHGLGKPRRFSTNMLRGAAFDAFKAFASRNGPFDALVCDNVIYSSAVSYASSLGIPCYYALHHIESLNFGQSALLDVTRGPFRGVGRPTRDLLVTCENLAAEISSLACARAVFPIARFEHEFLLATGIESVHYPYRPKGKTLRWCQRIRHCRARASSRDRALFLSSGTINGHNEESLGIVLRQLLSAGMPSNSELVITGMNKNELTARVDGLERLDETENIIVKGILPQNEFERLLASASALVIPRYYGFGALTRVADAAACGIPVLTNVVESVSGLDTQQAWFVENFQDWPTVMGKIVQSSARHSALAEESVFAEPGSPLELIKLDKMRNAEGNTGQAQSVRAAK